MIRTIEDINHNQIIQFTESVPIEGITELKVNDSTGSQYINGSNYPDAAFVRIDILDDNDDILFENYYLKVQNDCKVLNFIGWVNARGAWEYWVFSNYQDSINVANKGTVFERPLLDDAADQKDLKGRITDEKFVDKIKLLEPFATPEQLRSLSGIKSSEQIRWFNKADASDWVNVIISSNSLVTNARYFKSNTDLFQFEVEIEFPENIQQEELIEY